MGRLVKLVFGFLGSKPLIGGLLALAVAAGGYMGWTWLKTARLQTKLNEATVEVIRQDAVIEKQNEKTKSLKKEGERENREADIRALKELHDNPTGKDDGYGYGPEEMNRWLSDNP